MLFISKPIDLIKKNNYDFSLYEKNFALINTVPHKIERKIIEFLKNFKSISILRDSFKGQEIITEISIKYLNHSLYYKYTVELDGKLILIKIESDSESSNLFKFIHSNAHLVSKKIENRKHGSTPIYMMQFNKYEFITIIYDKDTYFNLLN